MLKLNYIKIETCIVFIVMMTASQLELEAWLPV